MLEIFELSDKNTEAGFSVVLTYEERKKSRHRSSTQCGKEIGWFLERGHVLEHGDVLHASSGEFIKVIAADESVSEAHCDDTLLLMRGAYHLGNRHVPLKAAFQPESGAYHGGGHHHHHEH